MLTRPKPNHELPLAVSSGDPAGIGLDITLMAWLRRKDSPIPPFYLLGDIESLKARAELLGLDVPMKSVEAGDASRCFADALPVFDLGIHTEVTAGEASSGNAKAVIASIRQSVLDIREGKARAIVTNPIAKHVLYEAGFTHPGHTEFLAELASLWGRSPGSVGKDSGQYKPVMMLAGPDLRTVPVTVHVALSEAVTLLTTELIVETGRITASELVTKFGIVNPRLALTGLNPHAGERGSMGREDIDVIAPAIAELRALGIDAFGPMPADTLFHAAARTQYDVALCMYHDQALIPVKTIAFDETVNVTLGLPFVRTSPDHGTAFDLAGTGKARADSFCAALRLADIMSRGTQPVDRHGAD